MKLSRLIPLLSLILFSLLVAVSCNPRQLSSTTPQSISLTISAAASLQDALTDLQSVYAQQQPDVSLTYNFGSSGALQQQIEQGAPVDVFVSAAAKQMDALQTKGLLLTDTRKNLLTNQIALIVSQQSTAKTFQDLTHDGIKTVAIGNPASVPAGQYGEEVLATLGVLERVKPKLVLAKDVRQVLSYVETGNADAGLVYITDAKLSPEVKVAALAPKGSHSPIVYPVAVLKDSKNIEAAKAFVQFLATARSKAVFQQYGFTVPADSQSTNRQPASS